MGPREVTKDIYLIGGADITDPRDCAVYLIDLGELVMIDAGAGASYDEIVLNIERLGLDPAKLKAMILTHCHIDHIGGAPGSARRLDVGSSCTSSTPSQWSEGTMG